VSTTLAEPMESVVVEEQVATTDDPADAAHIVMVPEGEPDQTPQAYVLRATIEGFPVTAVCGYVWVPGKDPRNKPVCSPCKEFFESNGRDLDKRRGNLPDA
jgi:hypothetical protein